MQPVIKSFPEQYFVGKQLSMSFAENRTAELWQSFMPLRNSIPNHKGTELYSIEVYPAGFHEAIDLTRHFQKWAAVEVSSLDNIPDSMESLVSPAGQYAVFRYRGLPTEAMPFYQYIFNQWLPASEYLLDNRPHLAIMGDAYKHNQPDSEEDICIPVRLK